MYKKKYGIFFLRILKLQMLFWQVITSLFLSKCKTRPAELRKYERGQNEAMGIKYS